MTHETLLMATALKAYKMHFGHIDPESEEGRNAFAYCMRRVRAILN